MWGFVEEDLALPSMEHCFILTCSTRLERCSTKIWKDATSAGVSDPKGNVTSSVRVAVTSCTPSRKVEMWFHEAENYPNRETFIWFVDTDIKYVLAASPNILLTSWKTKAFDWAIQWTQTYFYKRSLTEKSSILDMR